MLSRIVRFYQLFLSPLLHTIVGGNFGCRFEPTCSQYLKDAMEVHGPVKGFGLGTLRVLRCQPFSKGGYDPVRPAR